MERTNKNLIKLLKAIRDNKAALRENHDVEFVDLYLTQKLLLNDIIRIMTNKEYFEDLCSIYEVEEDEK